MMDFSGALSWTSTDPTSTSSEMDNGSYKDTFLKYHVRIRSASSSSSSSAYCRVPRDTLRARLCGLRWSDVRLDVICLSLVRLDNWENGSYSIKALTGHRDFIRCVRFDKNHRAVSSGVDRTVCVWDLKTGACLQTMKGHTGGTLTYPA
jgi:WD40 repeat protein